MIEGISNDSDHFIALEQKIILHSLAHALISVVLFVCVEVLRPSQPIGVMSSAVSLSNHTFTGQA